MELDGVAARTCPSTVEPADRDTPSRQTKDSESLNCHPATPPRLARDMVPRHLASSGPSHRRGLHQGAKLRRMREPQRRRVSAAASPTVKLPRSFIESNKERMDEHHRFMDRWMHGTL